MRWTDDDRDWRCGGVKWKVTEQVVASCKYELYCFETKKTFFFIDNIESEARYLHTETYIEMS